MDDSSAIIENIKWFLYDDTSLEHIKNEFGFSHETEFVSWVGDGHSFILKEDTGEYRITISKEVE